MKSIIPGNRLTAFLLLACTLLAGIIALEWPDLSRQAGGGIRSGEIAPATGAGAQVARTEFTAPDIKTFDEILERPLFREGRTPPPPPAVEATAVPTRVQQPRLLLEGVAISPEVRVAVVRDLRSNSLLQLEEGMEHQGWRVEQVTRSGATLKNGEQIHELLLKENLKVPSGRSPNNGRTAPVPLAGARIVPGNSRSEKPVTADARQHDPAPPANGAIRDNGQGDKAPVPAAVTPQSK